MSKVKCDYCASQIEQSRMSDHLVKDKAKAALRGLDSRFVTGADGVTRYVATVEEGNPDAITLGSTWPATITDPASETVETVVARAKAEMLAHVKAGVIPADAVGFGTLHDYVDANCYGGLCDDALYDYFSLNDDNDGWQELGALAQDQLHNWIKSGGLRSEA